MNFWIALALLAALAAAVRGLAVARRRPPEGGRVELRLVVADRGETVEALVRGLLGVIAAYGGPAADVTVVDAGSSDDTPAILARLAREDPGRLKVFGAARR